VPVSFNSAAALELQLTEFSCSVGATFWCLSSLGVDISHRALQELMVPALVSPDVGLLDSSGATIARLLRDRFGLAATNAQVSFDDVASRAGRQPIALGGRRWFVDPASGEVTGHWVAVRGFDGERLILANPGGSGPKFGQQSLSRADFAERGSFSAVFIESGSAASGGPAGRRFRIANTAGQGANMRAEPSSTSPVVRALREGADLTGDEHAWRHVTDGEGNAGWVAEEFLTAQS
jgi:hypothetical protein